MEKETVVKIVENAYNKIKRDNPYTNFKFVSDLIGDELVAEEVKKIIVSKDKNAPKLVLDLLFENNCASKYVEIADYMNYPLVVTEGSFAFEPEDDRIFNEELEDLESKIGELVREQNFPVEWGVDVTKLSNDCVEVKGKGGLNFHIIPQENGNFTLMVSGQTKKENVDFDTISHEIVRRIEQRHANVNYL